MFEVISWSLVAPARDFVDPSGMLQVTHDLLSRGGIGLSTNWNNRTQLPITNQFMNDYARIFLSFPRRLARLLFVIPTIGYIVYGTQSSAELFKRKYSAFADKHSDKRSREM